ncbi:MAG: hypothetical protein ACLS5E_11985 [[Ruminococcus] lactaris]
MVCQNEALRWRRHISMHRRIQVRRAKQKVVDLAKLVSKYSGPIKLNIVNFTDIQLVYL